MPTVSTDKPVKRDGRNSKKRLEAARLDAERARLLQLGKANYNAFAVLRLIQAANISSEYQSIRCPEVDADPGKFVAEFLGVSTKTLADGKFLKDYFKVLWDTRFEGCTHESCKARALKDLRVPAWSHLVGTTTCVCCGRSLGCEHSRNKSLSQEECRSRNIYHGGRCYSVCECLDCGEINAVDSSD